MHIDIQLKIVYQDDYLKLEVDQALGFISGEWLRHPDSLTFRDSFHRMVSILLSTESKYWLANDQILHYILFSDQTWIITEMLPLLDTSQLVKFARLTTSESMLLLDVIRVLGNGRRMTEHGFETQLEIFTNKEEALGWLFADI